MTGRWHQTSPDRKAPPLSSVSKPSTIERFSSCLKNENNSQFTKVAFYEDVSKLVVVTPPPPTAIEVSECPAAEERGRDCIFTTIFDGTCFFVNIAAAPMLHNN